MEKNIVNIDKTFDENFTDSKSSHSIFLMSSAIRYLCHAVKFFFRNFNFLCGNFQLKSLKKKTILMFEFSTLILKSQF